MGPIAAAVALTLPLSLATSAFAASSTAVWQPTVGSTAWDHTAPNFGDYFTGQAETFTDGNLARFTNVGIGSVNISSSGVSPSSTTFANSNSTYTLIGGGILTGSYFQTGAGTVVFSNNGNNYTGGTNVQAGTLITTVDNAIPSNTNVFVAYGSTLNLNGYSDSVGTLTMATGTVTTGVGTLTVNEINLPNNDGSGVISGNVSGSSSGLLANAGQATNLNLSANLQTAGQRAVFEGNGTIQLNGKNSGLTGISEITSTNTVLGTNMALGPANTSATSGPLAELSGNLRASTDLTGANAIPARVELLSVGFSGTNPIEFSGNILVAADYPAQITVNNTTTLSGNIQDAPAINSYPNGNGPSGPASVTMYGSGTLVIASASTKAGTFTVDGGTLSIAATGSLRSVSSLVLSTDLGGGELVLQNVSALSNTVGVSVTGSRQAIVALPEGTTQIGTLVLKGTDIPAGLYAPGNLSLIADGLVLQGPADAELQVSMTAPEPATFMIVTLTTPLLLKRRRRMAVTMGRGEE